MLFFCSYFINIEQKGHLFWNGPDHVHSEPLLNLRSAKVEKLVHVAGFSLRNKKSKQLFTLTWGDGSINDTTT